MQNTSIGSALVMAGLVPAIHVFLPGRAEDVDARHKAGHDEELAPELLRLAGCRGCFFKQPRPPMVPPAYLL
jgi:hypothetical protein